MADNQKTTISVCTVSELEPGARRVVEHEGEPIVVFNCAGTPFAIEDRCSHEDEPLNEG
jgi:3-phenylpropionate/trans-cinnamate dioxygenase ferredoxin subunit